MAIAVYFAQQLSILVTARRLICYLSDQAARWGKIHIISELECVRSVYAQKSIGEKRRDSMLHLQG